jgi:FLVCR family feline leukemia virus subgroup C receptor-related protein
MPPMLVHNHDDLELIGDDLRFMFYLVAGWISILVVLVLVCEYFLIGMRPEKGILIEFLLFILVFQSAPPTPPSAAQEHSKTPNPLQSSPFLHSIKRLLLNRNYILLLISYGMNVGVFYAISTLLNQVRLNISSSN